MPDECLGYLDDFEFVFSKNAAYRINIYTDETIYQNYSHIFNDYAKMVEGVPDDMTVLVDISVYRAWLETKDARTQ